MIGTVYMNKVYVEIANLAVQWLLYLFDLSSMCPSVKF